MSTITLFCLIHGNNLAAAFSVKVEKDITISELKKIIKDENLNEFSGIDARNLKLWKVEVSDNDQDEINELIQQSNESKKKLMLIGIRYVEDYWIESPPKKCIHIIVEPPVITASNRSTSTENISLELEKMNISGDFCGTSPLSPNFVPEFLKIVKENPELMKQITLSLEKERDRNLNEEDAIVRGSMKAEGGENIVLTFNPGQFFGGSKYYFYEFTKAFNEHLRKNPLIEKTETTVQLWFNQLMDVLGPKLNDEIDHPVIIDKSVDKQSDNSYLRKFMPDFNISKNSEGVITLRLGFYFNIEYQIVINDPKFKKLVEFKK